MRKYQNIILILGAVSLSGCASMFSIGSPEYACKGLPEGVRCLGVHDVYALTDGDDYEEKIDRVSKEAIEQRKRNKNSFLSKIRGKATHKGASKGRRAAKAKLPGEGSEPSADEEVAQEKEAKKIEYVPTVITKEVRAPIPVRQPAKIMRVMITPWESDDDALHVPGYVYIEVEKRKWTIGERAKVTQGRLTPLQVKAPVRPSGRAGTKRSGDAGRAPSRSPMSPPQLPR